MFSKLLKYDNRAILKYWWIGAFVSLGVSLLGGFCIQIINVDYTSHTLITVLAGIGMFFSILGISLLPLFTEILIIVRYFKNFFTDEGYLTFTLPVKKTQLLDSKLLSALVFNIAVFFVVALDAFVMLAIGIPEEFFSPVTWRGIFEIINAAVEFWGGYTIPYIFLAVLILVALTVGQLLFLFACITFASSVVKKHKILMSIGVYYGVNLALSFVYQILAYGGVSSVFFLVTGLTQENYLGAVLFILLCALGICIAVAGALYLLVLWLLDRRLNLE